MKIIRRILIGLVLFVPALAHAQSYPGNPNAGQVWIGQGPNAPPAWLPLAGDCNLSSAGGINCPTLGGVPAGALFPLGIGTGLSSSGGKLNIANQLPAGGPIGSATVIPVITYNAQGQLTAVSQVSISGSGAAGYGIAINANVISAPLIAVVSRPLYGGL